MASASFPEQLLDVTKNNIYSTILRPADFVRCDLVGPRAVDLQMRLRSMGRSVDVGRVSVVATVLERRFGETFFYVSTGGRGAVNGGTASRWFIDVAFRTGGNATTPIDYGITCRAGNGMEIPWLRTTVTNGDFP